MSNFYYSPPVHFGSDDDLEAYMRRVFEIRRTMRHALQVAPMVRVLRTRDGRVLAEGDEVRREDFDSRELNKLIRSGHVIERDG